MSHSVHTTDKHDELTAAEIARFRPSAVLHDRIRHLCQLSGKQPAQFRILDWGCGRGRMVAWLRRSGFDAYGLDADSGPIARARNYFASQGWSADLLLRVLDSSGRAPFEDEFFDLVISQQVLEHVRDLRSATTEMSRITKKGGHGFHTLPAHRRVMEGHLYMPLVHWLPKNTARRALIRMYTQFGVDPKWSRCAGLPARAREQHYYQYSVEKTFYRKPSEIVQTFARAGLDARVVSVQRSTLQRYPLAPIALRVRPLAHGINALISNFLFVDLETAKPS